MEFEVRIVFNDLWNFEGGLRLGPTLSPSQQLEAVYEYLKRHFDGIEIVHL